MYPVKMKLLWVYNKTEHKEVCIPYQSWKELDKPEKKNLAKIGSAFIAEVMVDHFYLEGEKY